MFHYLSIRVAAVESPGSFLRTPQKTPGKWIGCAPFGQAPNGTRSEQPLKKSLCSTDDDSGIKVARWPH